MKLKVSSTDFTKESLPKTRFEVFSDKIKNQYRIFIFLGLLMLIFFLPTLACEVLKDSLKLSLEVTEYESIDFFINLLKIPSLMIFSVGLAGGMRVIKILIFDEPVFFLDDFIKGIKNNFSTFLFGGFMIGFVSFFNNWIGKFPLDPKFLLKIPSYLFIIFILPVFIIYFCLQNIYKIRIKNSLLLGSYLYLKNLFFIFFFYIISLIPFFTLSIPFLLIKYFALALAMLFLFPLTLTILMLAMNKIFDKEINKTKYIELYEKGIYKRGY